MKVEDRKKLGRDMSGECRVVHKIEDRAAEWCVAAIVKEALKLQI